jgi:hypothetical protein
LEKLINRPTVEPVGNADAAAAAAAVEWELVLVLVLECPFSGFLHLR